MLFASVALAATPVLAQTSALSSASYPAPGASGAATPIGAANAVGNPATPASVPAATGQAPPVRFPALTASGLPSGADLDSLATAIAAARRGQASAAQAAIEQIADPAARKVALWALVDADGEQLPFFQLDQARRDLAGWPRVTRRQQVAEKAIDGAGLPPAQVIAWFQAAAPTTPQGAMALAGAYQLAGRNQDAQALIKTWWRNRPFDAGVQRTMLTRFGAYLTMDDHIARADTLLYGSASPALSDVLAMLPPDQRALADARLALHDEASDANARVAALPPALAKSPGLAVDSARYLLSRNLDEVALELASSFPAVLPNADAASKVWVLRRQMINTALRDRDYRAAYAAATNTGLTTGVDYTEAEFYAGWIAFSKLHDPAAADQHFARIQAAAGTPITQARALYWRGRAAEAMGDPGVAKAFYTDGARYLTTFYGQLAAGRAGIQQISLGHDPEPTPADRARFDSRELVRGARMLAAIGDKELFRAFMLCMADNLPNGQEYAMLVDMARGSGDQDLAMRVVRLGAQHGYVLPDRGYPVRSAPNSPEAAEAAMVFGITRQESGFDPYVRSPVGARGMMQLMPRTAEVIARRIGEPYGAGRLDDPDYNMRLGASYLGHMINNFSGSYVLAAAAYNAGPGRPAEWVGYCGDPRTSSVDPVDFIECIPFSETRNYVMRVLEAAEVYRARLNGGAAPLNLAADLKRGGYLYQVSNTAPPAATGGVSALPPSRTTAVAAAGGAAIIDASTPISIAPGVSVQGAVR
ncbi:MAG: transglycosylase SLT domain-containing protein [Caulobacteraceae bacterium]|nr:transglycosylase SLT domain-containing protein [Caulobacteraceae bacterium]